MKLGLIAASALAGCLVSGMALAGDPETERARALFEEAGELERRGQWAAAQERLRAALRIRETPQLHYALGWALENDDRLLEAKQAYETATRLGRERGSDEVVRLATARLSDVDGKLARVRVRVTGRSSGAARVLVDGVETRRDDETTVNPGSHVVRIERADESAVEQVVYVPRGSVRTVEIDGGVAGRDSEQDRHGTGPVGRATDAAAGRGDGVTPFLLLSGGIVLALGGGALVVSGASDRGRHDALQNQWCAATACTSPTTAGRPETPEAAVFRQDAADAASLAQTKQVIGFALGGVGIVGAAVGAILLATEDSQREPPAKAKQKPGGFVRAGATPLPGGAFATTSFAF